MGTDTATAEVFQGDGATEGNVLFGNDLNIDKNLVNICVNFNNGQMIMKYQIEDVADKLIYELGI